MKNLFGKSLIPAASVVLAVLLTGLLPDVCAEKVAAGVKPGPRGPVGPDVALTRAEEKLFAKRVTVKGSTGEAVQAACDKASKEGTLVVFLPAGKYEFKKTVNVPAGITILGVGSKTHCLSLIRTRPMFSVKAPNVRITRLRMEGPSTSRKSRGRNTGVSVTAEDVRVDHCEVFTFCHGVNFSGGSGQIDHNHIHHCITNGLGYGVSFYSGARVLICDNDFGPCRHCLASNGALDWSSPKRVGKYIHKSNVRKTHWELVHNRFYGDETTDYHRLCVIDTHPGMDGTFVVENNLIENIRIGLGIRDGRGIVKGNFFRNITRTAISITYGKHNGIVVEGTMPRDIEVSKNRFEKVAKKYRIGKAENISIDGKILPETKTGRKGPKTKIPRLKPMGDKATKKDKTAVPDDRVMPLGFKVADYPTYEKLLQQFKKYHQESEKIRNPDGSWGKGYGKAVKPPIDHPLVRDTARRVLGYIDAYHACGGGFYMQRAKEGLEHLLKIQRPDGQFIWWYGDPKKGRTGGGSSLYVTGIPTAAFMEGYKLFKDARYLAAANKACDYMCGVANSGNANYNLFATWALAANYEITKKKAYLDRAMKFALHAIGKEGSGHQLPPGGWSDLHNQCIWYHGIILRGLATLLSVMPENDPNREKIQKATYKALNHLRARQRPDGGVLAFLRSTSSSGRGTFPGQAIGIIVVWLNWPVTDSVRLAAKGICKYPTRSPRGTHVMAIGSLLRAYKHTGGTKRPKILQPSTATALPSKTR